MTNYVLLWLGLAFISGIIASSKGRSGFGYFLLGLLLPIVGVLLAIGISSKREPTAPLSGLRGEDLINCHQCHGLRRADSASCPHCRAPKFDPRADLKKCPMCAEMIKREAIKCRFCGADVGPKPALVAYAVDGEPASPVMAARMSSQVSPVQALPAETGRCPKCGGPRQQFDLGCTSCGSKKAAVFA